MPLGLTDREAAKLAGCSHVAIGKAKKSGRIQQLADGSVARDAISKWDSERRAPRGGNRRSIAKFPLYPENAAVAVTTPDPTVSAVVGSPMQAPLDGDARNAEAALALLTVEGVFADRADAERYRDSYVARLRQIEFDRASGAVVDAAEAAQKIGTACARVRNRLLSLPAEQAPQLHRCKTVAEVQDLLLFLLTRALEELTGA